MDDYARSALVRTAFRLEGLTLGWMLIEAGVAIAAGLAAGSLSLTAFGIDSVIEFASACLLLWRLTVELKRGAAFSEEVERRAAQAGGVLLFALAAYVLVSSAWGLFHHHAQTFSLAGTLLTAVAIPVMYGLAKAKLRIVTAIGSRALRTDAVESFTCLYLSAVVLAGLLAQRLTGAWWIDGAAGLILVPLLVREGLEAWEEEEA